ncbi:hypothetical protein MMPV_008183 [Pyropia vietnamensis]
MVGVGVGVGVPSAVRLAAREDSAAAAAARAPPTATAAATAALTLASAAASSPAPYKKGAGEDAWFIVDDAAGVFDGVGGWASQGVDAGVYARALASGTAAGVRSRGPTGVAAALADAVAGADMLGSSTAAVIGLDAAAGSLVGCNLGDSGVRVIRGGAVVYRSAEQQYSFNFPAQVSAADRGALAVAEPIAFGVEEGDWVLLATDGLLDNMWEAELLRLVAEAGGEAAKPAALAEAVRSRAVELSQMDNYESPFSWGAKQAGMRYPTQGKPDDVTVVFCRVQLRDP